MTITKPHTLNQLGSSITLKVEKANASTRRTFQDWIDVGALLSEARQQFGENDKAFGKWCAEYDGWGVDRSWLRTVRDAAEGHRRLLGTETPVENPSVKKLAKLEREHRKTKKTKANGQNPTPRHPAKFTDTIIPVIDKALGNAEKVLDPFAGTGRIHQLENRETVGIEIEPEWANQHPDTQIGNALDLPFADQTFDAVATSPTYGNRLADHHNNQDGSERRSYTHDLNRPLDPNNSGDLQWGDEYKTFHRKAWTEAVRVLKPGGKLVLNISDHIRDGKAQGVPAWHANTLGQLGLELVTAEPVPTPRQRHGENAGARMDAEWVYTFQLL